MNYYISDLHFFHKNVTGEGFDFDGRSYAAAWHRIARQIEETRGGTMAASKTGIG